jgi:hypothetical protein
MEGKGGNEETGNHSRLLRVQRLTGCCLLFMKQARLPACATTGLEVQQKSCPKWLCLLKAVLLIPVHDGLPYGCFTSHDAMCCRFYLSALAGIALVDACGISRLSGIASAAKGPSDSQVMRTKPQLLPALPASALRTLATRNHACSLRILCGVSLQLQRGDFDPTSCPGIKGGDYASKTLVLLGCSHGFHHSVPSFLQISEQVWMLILSTAAFEPPNRHSTSLSCRVSYTASFFSGTVRRLGPSINLRRCSIRQYMRTPSASLVWNSHQKRL